MNKLLALLAVAALTAIPCRSEEHISYSAEISAQASQQRYAPYMLASWNSGRTVAGKGVWHGGRIERALEPQKRLSWSYELEYIAGCSNGFRYGHYNAVADVWTVNDVHPAALRLIQLYGQIKYRSVYLLAGMKERPSGIVDGSLSSGDLVRSNNARPIPGIAAGFFGFVDIPFTNGWVQIDGELMYGKMTDKGFDSKQFNYYEGLVAEDLYYTYKRCYFRSKPSMPFSVTLGMQTAGEFGGNTRWYRRGRLAREENRGFHMSDLWDMFFPREGSGEGYYKGNSLGSWDFKARYSFGNGSSVSAYFQWPWEDGSGIGRRNGWDGLWGVQYNFAPGGIVRSVLFEYLDFTNQGGPIHHTAGDYPGTNLSSEANGGDNYYNNDFYGSYSNYGMSIGTPFLLSPLYNSDGYARFAHNRSRGFHAAACGNAGTDIDWSAKVSYRKAGGEGRLPAAHKLYCTSVYIHASWCPGESIPGLRLKAQVALDRGNLQGNNFGACIGISYSGMFTIGKNKRQ